MADRPPRQSKIVATLGPASSGMATLRAMIEAGVDVFRLNCSHGSTEERAERIAMLRALERTTGRPLAILLDLQGPKLRIGTFAAGAVELGAGDAFALHALTQPGDDTGVFLPHPELFSAAEPGDCLLLDDGRIALQISAVSSLRIDTCVVRGGRLSNRKGISLPGRRLPIPALTERDRTDLEHGLEHGVDWVALSFVQDADDIAAARALIGTRAALLAKIERPGAIDQLDAIADAADALMVARGDLGVELSPEMLPPLQRRIVRAARQRGKPVIVATQMLESMIHANVPTRAEVSDVATAVYEGADAVMLSAETASGRYPLEAIRVMDRVLRNTEADPEARTPSQPPRRNGTTCAVCAAVRTVAEVLPLGAIVAYTASGETARRISAERPPAPILGLTPDLALARRLALHWGVQPLLGSTALSTEQIVEVGEAAARSTGLHQPGRPLAIVAGMPFGTPGSTNLLRLVWPDSLPATGSVLPVAA